MLLYVNQCNLMVCRQCGHRSSFPAGQLNLSVSDIRDAGPQSPRTTHLVARYPVQLPWYFLKSKVVLAEEFRMCCGRELVSGWLLRDIKVVRAEPLYEIFVTQQQ